MRMDDGKVKTVGRDVTVSEVMEEVMKDLPYYHRSGGGLTLSGGESLCQPKFAAALFCAAKDCGLTTALESCAGVPFPSIEQVLPYLDLYLMDIKHVDEAKHKAFTGQSNRLILENAAKAAKAAKELIVRVPVIPTFNDTADEIRRIASFAKTLPGVEEVDLLPYHRLGQDKYRWLGREYTLAQIKPIPDNKMEELLEAARESGLRCQIGG
jgi:pyruvate formate lyase activating enzyme